VKTPTKRGLKLALRKAIDPIVHVAAQTPKKRGLKRLMAAGAVASSRAARQAERRGSKRI
jgi:hypothetical protein